MFSITDSLPKRLRRWDFWFWISLIIGGAGPVSAEVLLTTDFESGTLSEWTVFSTSNGTLGGKGFPSVAMCGHVDTIAPSRCFHIQAGQQSYALGHNVQQGGGIELKRRTIPGILRLSARVGVTYHSPNKKRNLHGGLFEWLVDGQKVADLDIGPIENGATVQHEFTGKVLVKAGWHLIQLRVTRPFQSGTGQPSPVQSVDDVMVELLPNPE